MFTTLCPWSYVSGLPDIMHNKIGVINSVVSGHLLLLLLCYQSDVSSLLTMIGTAFRIK